MSTKVLVVDDDVDFLSELKERLEGRGYEVVTAEGRGRRRHVDGTDTVIRFGR